MRKTKLLLIALMAMMGLSVNAADKVVGEKFTTIGELDGKLFAVVDESSSTAMGIGITGHGSEWDMYFGTYAEAYASNACYYKIEAAQGDGVEGCYYLRTYNSNGTIYYVWGNNQNGYFNSQPAGGTCCFAIGLNNQNGQDGKNLAVWSIEESEGKFALKNKGTGLYLHADNLPAKYEDAYYFTFCTLIEDPLPAAQEKYNALKEKYLAINSGLDVTDADALLANASTVDDVQDAINALINTFGTYLAGVGSETNVTSLIVNPSFESDFTGWTNSGMATQNNSSFPGKVDTKYCEAWQPNGTKGVSQTITLPQGLYRMSINSLARGVTSAKLYAGDRETAIDIADGSKAYNVEFLGNGTDVKIGFEGVGTGAGNSWLCVDNFQLTYVQNMTAEEFAEYIAKKDALAAYNDALAAAQAIVEGTISTTAYSNLQAIITANTLADGTAAQYNDAATALTTAATAAQALVDPYAEYLDTKAAADAIAAVEYTETTAGSHDTFASAITAQTSAADGATDVATINTATSTLKAAILTYIAGAEPKNDGEYFDITILMANPDFEDGSNGWTFTTGGAPGVNWSNCEYYQKEFDINQTVSGLPTGSYSLSVQAYQRPGWADNVYNEYIGGTDNASSVLYINSITSKVKNIAADAQSTGKLGDVSSWGTWPNDSRVGSEGAYKYVPNSQEGAKLYFDAGLYDATCAAVVTEADGGSLTLGFKSTKTHVEADWTIFDNFRLYYYGSSLLIYYKQYLPQLKSEASADLANGAYASVTGKEKADFEAALAAAPAEETEGAYKTVIDDIIAKQTAFQEAAPAYDALAAAKAEAMLEKITANVGTGVFQYDATTNNSLYTAYETAYNTMRATSAVYPDNPSATADNINAALTLYNARKAAYQNQALNAPDAEKRYWVTMHDAGQAWDGFAITFEEGGRTGEGDYAVKYLVAANANYNQALKFTHVEGDKYKISGIRVADGTELYLTGKLKGYSDGNNDQIRTIDDASKALEITVQATTIDNQFKLINETGTEIARNKETPDNGVYAAGDVSSYFTIQEASQASVTIDIPVAQQYATAIFPFAPSLPSGVKAYSCAEISDKTLTLVEVGTPAANVPYILENVTDPSADVYETLQGWGTAYADNYTMGLLTGTYTTIAAPNGSYILQKQGEEVAFYQVNTEVATPNVPANRAYLEAPSTARALYFDAATAIKTIEALTSGEAEIYGANGARQNGLKKGVNIIKRGDKTMKVMVK